MVFALLNPLHGQDTANPSVLGELRTKFNGNIADQTLAHEMRYSGQLLSLEQTYRARKDYYGARAVAAELARTEARIERLKSNRDIAEGAMSAKVDGSQPSAANLSPSGTFIFNVTDAELEEGVTLDEKLKIATGFRRPGAAAIWKLPKDFEPGGYEVILHYACSDGQGGVVRIEEDFFFLSSPIETTGGVAQFQSISLGILRIRNNLGSLRVVAGQVKADSLMTLSSVELVSCASQNTETGDE